jgi:hypothetical protein
LPCEVGSASRHSQRTAGFNAPSRRSSQRWESKQRMTMAARIPRATAARRRHPAIASLPIGHGRARRSARLARYPRNDQTGPTITAVLKGGPLGGRRIEVDVVEGRPPKDDRRARRRRKHVPVLPRGRGPHRSVRSMRVRVPRLAGEGCHSFVPRVAASEINDPHCRVGRQPRMTPPDARHPAAVPLRETSGRLGSRTTHARSGRRSSAWLVRLSASASPGRRERPEAGVVDARGSSQAGVCRRSSETPAVARRRSQRLELSTRRKVRCSGRPNEEEQWHQSCRASRSPVRPKTSSRTSPTPRGSPSGRRASSARASRKVLRPAGARGLP